MTVLVRLTPSFSRESDCVSNTFCTVVKNVAAHHAISAKFAKPVDNKGKTLVVQYEVKLQSMFPSDIQLESTPRPNVSSWSRWFGMWWSLS